MLALAEALSPYRDLAEICLIAADKDCAGLEHAKEKGLPTALIPYKGRPKAECEAEMMAALQNAQADWIILAGFMRILSPKFVKAFDGRILNIHPSLLPLYKGLDTHQRALDNGDSIHGASVHIVTEALDDGPILLQAAIDINDNDDAASLAARLLPVEHWLYQSSIIALVTGELSVQASKIIWQNQPNSVPEGAKVTICHASDDGKLS